MQVRLLQTNRMKVKAKLDEAPLHYLREWRTFRKMTQEELAASVGTTKGVISLLESSASGENGNGRRLSPKWARRLAPVLKARPGWLLDVDPATVPTSVIDVWMDIPDELKDQAIRTLVSFAKRA